MVCVQGASLDRLLISTETMRYAILAWDEATKSIRTLQKGTIEVLLPPPSPFVLLRAAVTHTCVRPTTTPV